jgi:hypothetical protein
MASLYSSTAMIDIICLLLCIILIMMHHNRAHKMIWVERVQWQVLAPAPISGHHHSDPLGACGFENVLELLQSGLHKGDGELVLYDWWALHCVKAVQQLAQLSDPFLHVHWGLGRRWAEQYGINSCRGELMQDPLSRDMIVAHSTHQCDDFGHSHHLILLLQARGSPVANALDVSFSLVSWPLAVCNN